MAKRNYPVPTDFVRTLRREISDYKKLPVKHQRRLANFILKCGSWWSQHKNPYWQDCMTIHYKELERAFGRKGFERINEELNIFNTTPNWYRDRGQTKGYKLQPEVQRVKSRYLTPRMRQVTEFTDIDGRTIKKLPNVIDSKDSDGKTTKWKVGPSNVVPIDTEALRGLWSDLRDRAEGKQDLYATGGPEDWLYKADSIGILLRYANWEELGYGNLPQRYQESTSGRLYAQGINLQNTPRAVRQAALNGLWDYDIENCHFTLFSQLAARYGYETKNINYYLQNKKAVRQELANYLGIDIGSVKVCLLSILYGARANDFPRNAIPKEIGQEKAKLLFEHEVFRGIHGNIKRGREKILKNYPVNNRGYLVNAFGKSIHKDKKPPQKLAHLLQGIEAQALRAVVEEIPDKVLVLMHDGFVTKKRISQRDMSAHVSAVTGYKVTLEGQKIALAPDFDS